MQPDSQQTSEPVACPPCRSQAIKADVSAKRTAAFAKRLLQVAQEAPGHFACGCLLLTSELLKVGGQWLAVRYCAPALAACASPRFTLQRLPPRHACTCLASRSHSVVRLPQRPLHPAAQPLQARPALWGAVLQPEENEADGLERFQDAPEDGPAAAAGQQQEGGRSGARRGARRAAAAGRKQGGGSSEEEGSSDEEMGEDLNGLAGSGSSSEEEGAEDSEGEHDLMPGLRQQQAAAAAAAAQRAAKQAADAADAQRWPASKEAYDLHKR